MKGEDVICIIKNFATLAGTLFTLHASQIRIDLPTLSDKDKEVWAVRPLSLSYNSFKDILVIFQLLISGYKYLGS